jgi:hypothetical protein
MEGLLNFIVAIQLTVGPCTAAAELDLISDEAQSAVLCVYLPTLIAYDQSPALEVAIDEIMTDYSYLASGWNNKPAQYSR